MKRHRMKKLLFPIICLAVLYPSCKSGRTYGTAGETGKITVASYYFPNYHPGDPRNVKNKGADWSEWELVKAARPRFTGHHQPNVPAWGYLDEKDPAVMARKIEAASSHGIDCFIFDWYMYEDGPFLNQCLDDGFLKAPNCRDIQFALMWANHDWVDIQPYTRGTEQKLLYPGKVTPKRFDEICDQLIRDYFLQPNYWKIDGKPYFSVYDISKFVESFGSLEATRAAMDRMREKAVAAGLKGVHWNLVVWGNPILPGEKPPANPRELMRLLGFDSATSYVWIHHVELPDAKTEYNLVRDKYFTYWDKARSEYGVPYFPNVTMGWDPSPRCDLKSEWANVGYPFMNTIGNNTPANFKEALRLTKEKLLADPNGPRILNINCWNEWTEGSYLEPDTVNGMAYLEAIKQVFTQPGKVSDALHLVKPDTLHFPAFVWKSEVPAGCPFPQSKEFNGIKFLGEKSGFHAGDTWYPSWADDDRLYSPFTDGTCPRLDGGQDLSISDGNAPQGYGLERTSTGQAVIEGDDPMRLNVYSLGLSHASSLPYHGRYPCGSLIFNGIWYYGTYCLDPAGGAPYGDKTYNWPWMGPFVGFRYSSDHGRTWNDCSHTPSKPLFGETGLNGYPVKIGSPHFVDFGKNMHYSPDGKAYLVAHGASPDDREWRFCNDSWITGDQVFLLRVTPSVKNMNDPTAYEFYAGLDQKGNAIWTRDFKAIKPLLEWNNNMGCVTVTYNAPLKKYLMCVTDGGNTCAKMNTYILESEQLTGEWKLISYLKNFGEQAYFVNIPSKFIGKDGKTLWLMYSGNFAPDWNGMKIAVNPPGTHYGMVLQKIELLKIER